MIDADQETRHEGVSRFLERLAHDRRGQRLAALQVSGRLIEPDSFVGLFLDQQKRAVALDDGGDGDMGLPNHDDDHGFRKAPILPPSGR